MGITPARGNYNSHAFIAWIYVEVQMAIEEAINEGYPFSYRRYY